MRFLAWLAQLAAVLGLTLTVLVVTDPEADDGNFNPGAGLDVSQVEWGRPA